MSGRCGPGLVRADPAAPGWSRRRRGRGWSFLDADGQPIADPATIARIKQLVIPPAWQDVWLNEAVKELAGEPYTCKDLRTWNATVLAAVVLAARVAEGGAPTSERATRRVEKEVMTAVAKHLGNTPAVARASYVDPRVIERFGDGHTVLPALRRLGGVPATPEQLDDQVRARIERAVVRLLRA